MDPDLTIVLLGHTGVGKSASGNTILGQTNFVSKRSSNSVTVQISEQTGTLFEKQISVIDTPGIIGSTREIKTLCQELRQSSRPPLFLVVVKPDRFTGDQERAVEAALRVIGDDDFHNCYLLFTGGDDLEDESLDEFINEDPGSRLKQVVDRFEGRHHLFNNKNGTQEQVRKLLEKSGHLRNDPADDLREEMRMVLLSLPGHGKSSSGNTILGSERFESVVGFREGTTETVCKSATVEGRWVKVVDTPGFTDKFLSPRKLFEEIMKSVEDARPGPHAFIIVVRIGRITGADIKMFKMLPKLFCRDASNYMMVLFTHGDELKGESIDDSIRADEHVSDLVSMCGDRFSVFDNTKRGNRVQVRHLLDKIDQMVTDNGGQHYTSEMFRDAPSIPVKIAIKWHEIEEWFRRQLEELNCLRELDRRRDGRGRRDGYNELNQMD